MVAGSLALVFAVIGVITPGLPTTPLLLLSAYCYAKSSKRIHKWLTETRLYKKYIADFAKTKSMTRKTKAKILIIATLAMIASCIAIPNTIIRIILIVGMGIMHYVFYTKIKTVEENVVYKKTKSQEEKA